MNRYNRRMPFFRRVLTLLVVLGILLAGWSPAYAQEQSARYFPETGHWVIGEFLAHYDLAKDPLLLYGYPITDAFQDPLSGLTVQYFSRARFELHIEATPGARVKMSPLGSLLYQPGERATLTTETPACKYFAQAGHNVCYSFLDFFYSYGGIEQFGYPISELEKQDDLYVQYFERARFEWHPELPIGQRVTLPDLGRIYFDQRVGNPSLLAPNVSNGIAQSLIQLKARVFVGHAIITANSEQSVFVIVQDQYLRPVPQASVALVVRFPSGKEDRFRLPLTDNDGISTYTFKVGSQPSDQIVEVSVDVSKGGLQKNTGTWFRIWW